MASVFSRTKQGDNTKPKRTSFIPEEEQNSGPEYGRVEVVYNRNKKIESKYLKRLDMWFILPVEPIANALTKYYHDKMVITRSTLIA